MVIVLLILLVNGMFLSLYSINLLILLMLAGRNGQKCNLTDKKIAKYPMVTIQIPLFNERYVAERIIRGAVEINYPIKKKEIQVLDDSTDDTLEISKKLVAEYRQQGHQISLIHRNTRTGQKGGALREGLERATGEYLLIFDADFIPNREILNKLIPYFLEDDHLGMIQTRWGHINPDFSSLTRAQSIFIDCHFSIDQVARAGSGLFMNFNGTAGMWRKECVRDAGNWQDDTLTEDLDLSYRAGLGGWKLRYFKNFVNKAELPVQLEALKSQQFRWAKGSIQTTKKLIGEVFKSNCSLFKKLEAVLHLAYYSVHLLLLINISLAVPLLASNLDLGTYSVLAGSIAGLFSVGLIITVVFLIISQALTYSDWRTRLSWIPATVFIGSGLAVSNSLAILEALIGKKSSFLRTPKWGVREKKDNWIKNKYNMGSSSLLVPLLELFFGLYSLAGSVMALFYGRFFLLPCFLVYSVSFLYIFFLGIVQRGTLIRFARESEINT